MIIDDLTEYTAMQRFHRLWTKAVGQPNYVKAEWIWMERYIIKIEDEAAQNRERNELAAERIR